MSKTKRLTVTAAAGIILLILSLITVTTVSRGGAEQITCRETTVQKGDLVVGISESGAVDVGCINQVFELDLSALQRAMTGENNSASNGSGASNAGAGGSPGGDSGGGFNMFDQIFNQTGGGNNTGTDTVGSLVVAEVLVSVGQQVSAGDVLYLLEETSAAEIEEKLRTNVEKAEADLNAVKADQKLSKQKARYTFDSSVAYGNYASTEYESTIASLEENLNKSEKELTKAQELAEEYREQLQQTEADYQDACTVLENCEWSRDNTDKWSNTYYYVMYFQMAQTAQSNADTLKQKKEQLEQNLEQAEQNVETCTAKRDAAKRSLELGRLEAGETLSLRQLAYSASQETYDIATGYLEEEAREQEETYADAKEKWEEFSSHVDGNAIKANYDGVITEVSLKEGDSIHTNDTLVTLYDANDVSMKISLDEDDRSNIAPGTEANVSFTAYPDTVFKALVTDIGDAETDSSGNVIYGVTITLQGDVSGLFQGMTGDVTFITKETREVLYVSNRAIIREGTASYVKMKDENGQIRKQEVRTGFSDGINVEILEGLIEGDVVLIESKVSEA